MRVIAVLVAVLAVGVASASPPAREVLLARRLVDLGQFDDARAILEPLVARAPIDDAAADLLAQVYDALKDWRAKADLIERRLAQDSSNAGLLPILAETLFRLGEDTRAESVLERFIAKAPEDPNAIRSAAEVYTSAGRLDRAIRTYEEGRARIGGQDTFSEELAFIHESRGDYESAVSERRRQIAASPASEELVSARIMGLADVPGGGERIERALEKWSRERPRDPVPARLLGDLAMKGRELAEAWDHYKRADALSGGSGVDLMSFLTAARREGFWEECRDAARYVMRNHTDPKVVSGARWALAEALEKLGKINEAVAHLDTIAASGGKDAALACATIGEIRLRASDDAGAQAAFARADSLGDPSTRAIAQWGMCTVFLWRGDVERASARLQEALRLRLPAPLRDRAAFTSAEILLLLGRHSEARDAYAAFAASLPASDWANDALGRASLLDLMADDSALVEEYARAVLLSYGPNTVGAIDALISLADGSEGTTLEAQALWDASGLQLSSGRARWALETCERIASLDPKLFWPPFAIVRQGEILLGTFSSPDKAAAAWERVLVEFPDSPASAKARKLLEQLSRTPG